MIGVPSLSGKLNTRLWAFLHACERLNDDPEFPWRFEMRIVVDRYPVEWARNLLVGYAIKADADRIWFIDEDMLPDRTSLELLKVDADIVAGRAFIWDAKTDKHLGRLKLSAFHYNLFNDHKFVAHKPNGADMVVDVDAVGTASMLVKREVLEDRRLWTGTKYTGLDGKEYDLEDEVGGETDEWGPPLFQFVRKPNGAPLRGEDLDFCYRAKQLGYSVKCHLGSSFGHYKPVNLDEVGEMTYHAIQQATQPMAKAG